MLVGAITCLLVGITGRLQGQAFTNIATVQGVDFSVNSDFEGTAVSFYDFDNDGWDDLTVGMWNDSIEFHQNQQGQLDRLPSFIDGPGATRHVLWIDYNNDGEMDLFITTKQGTHRLFRNDGNFQFTDISEHGGFGLIPAENYGASWGDYDRDGDLDVYVCTYEGFGDESEFEKLNHLYRNNGDDTFTDVTLEAGVGNGIKQTFQAIWIDPDHDGWQDLYVMNDRVQSNNAYYSNNHDGTFTDIAADNGSLVPNSFPMSLTVGDVNNDGGLDIFMTNTGTAENPGRFLIDQGDGTYQDQAAQYGLGIEANSWGAAWVDADNDMFQDLYVATGPPLNYSTDILFMRNMAGTYFEPSPGSFPSGHEALSLTVARGDLNNDGYPDLFVQNMAPDPGYLWLNSGGMNHYIKITPHGTVSNRMAIGTWIRVYSGGICQTQYTLCGEDHLGQSSQHRIFGLGANTEIDSVEVEYQSGHIDRYYGPIADQDLQVTEGETIALVITPLGSTNICPGAAVVLDAGEHFSYSWSTGDTLRSITASTPGSYSVTITTELGVVVESAPITITLAPIPFIADSIDPPSCNAAQDGTISIENLTGVAAQEVLWSNGSMGELITGLEEGIYHYLYTDVNGCTNEGDLELIAPPLLDLVLETSPEQVGADGVISVFVFGGTMPYTVAIDGQVTTIPITGLIGGTYEVTVTDAQGCATASTAVVNDNTGLGQSTGAVFSFFPNPTNGPVTLTLPAHIEAVRLCDVNGREVLMRQAPLPRSLDLSAVASGSYVLQGLVDGVPIFRTTVLIMDRSGTTR